MWSNLSAETTTTDNLLTNNSFTTDTSGWELSDSNQEKVKRDPNSYSDSASKSVRFRYQGGSISQDVDISNVPGNHIVKEINMGYQSIGCGNTGSQWCNAGADDTVTSTITLSSTDTAEVISNVTAVPYEDGWNDYSFSEEVLGTFNTDDLNISLTITGNDTGNSSNWYGPIIDNINLTLTIEEYIAPVAETTIQGLDLSTEITLDIIDIPDIQIEIPEIVDIPEIEIDIPNTIDMPELTEVPTITEEIKIEIPEIAEVEPIQEIEEIKIDEQDTVETKEETTDTVETKEEGVAEEKTISASNENSNIRNKGEITNDKAKLKTKESVKKKTNKEKNDKKESKENKGAAEKPKSKSAITKSKPTSKTGSSVEKAPSNPQLTLPIEYLQVLQDTITIYEAIDLTQEMIYGGQQEYNLNTSGITVVSLDNNSSSRWGNLQNESKRYQAPSYNRRSR